MNKNIFKLLGLSLFISNFSIYSSLAINDIEVTNRYETLEDEFITINDSVEGELHEIEIFGNTIQDENDLEDIQSVGDLYTDENKNPILDNQGRKQYKINIISQNSNLFTGDNTMELGAWDTAGNNYITDKEIRCKGNFTPLPKGIKNGDTVYLVLSDKSINSNTNLHAYDKNKVRTGFDGAIATNFINGTASIKIIDIEKIQYFSFRAISTNTNCTWGLFKEAEDLVQSVKHTREILLPTQLQRVGNLADRLYWDDVKGRYIVEKNIGASYIDETDIVETTPHGTSKYRVNMYYAKEVKFPHLDMSYSARAKNRAYYTSDVANDIGLEKTDTIDSELYMYLYKDEYDNSAYYYRCKEYFNENNVIVYGELKKTELIETNITSKLKIPTYNGKTHIYVETENGITPTLKVTVDRLEQIAKNAIEEARLNPTMENISLARLYVNILSDSIYKDQLHEELNKIFSSDITFNKKTATANLDVYIKSENMLLMNLSTNSITFSDYSGVDEIEQENAFEISVNSSLPYQLNAYLLDEIYNNDRTKKIDTDRLQIKDNEDIDYKEFVNINEKLVLKDTCDSGNDKSHSIDLKLKGGNAYESDIYKTVIKFEAEQK